MSWFKTGWSEANEEGSKSPFESKGPQRVWMPPDAKEKLLFLEDEPTSMWEHGYQVRGKWGHFEPCHTKNKISDRCPICDSGDKMFPSFIGHFTVISLTPWFTKKDQREVCFSRKVFSARMGSKDKPGILKKLERLRTKESRLRGCVYEVLRTGAKTESCGDDFTLVEKIDIDKIEEYGKQQLAAYVARVNAKLPPKDHVTVDKLYERNPWKPFNFEKLYATDWAPKSLAELDRLFGTNGGAGGGVTEGGGGGGGGKDSGSDDDSIPY